ncbi:hypothetical protein B0H17DRAFT_1067124 [Mycena rosella]|uniref:Homeobox domain-containing protein n=1 Tax=Mycena rosella TaxID=1033263 RepID=A0AAD7DE98_MYCRO|nr:hypothetical protein B0H17DRAFT_1067124 [Mycena rosella]
MADSHAPTKMPEDAPKKRNVVRATPAQIKVLRAAYGTDKTYTTEEVQRLSSETGLTSQWIRAWFGRYKKKKEQEDQMKEREVSTEPEDAPPRRKGRPRNEPEDDAPPRKKGRPRNEPSAARIEVSSVKAPPKRTANLPPPDDSYMPPMKTASPPVYAPMPTADRSFTSSSTSSQHNPFVSQPAPGYVYYHGFDVKPGLIPHLAPIPIPEQQKNSTSSRSNPQHFAPSLFYQKPPSRPMLLPRPSDNLNPAPQRVSDQSYPINNWGATPTRVSTAISSASSVPHSRNTPAAHLLGTTSTSSMALTPAALLRTSFHQQHSQQAPGSELSPFRPPLRNTPAHVLQSPFVSPLLFSQDQFKHTNSMITPSAVRSYMPEHDVEQDDFPTSTTFDTPINDRLLFSSMLNLTPQTRADASPTMPIPNDDDDSAFDVDKAPLKHLSVLHADFQLGEGGAQTALTMDDMCERLFDETLAESDPFQAAMGLVFLSKMGLKWED